MSTKRLGSQTVFLSNPPSVAGGAAVVGSKEGEGPLRSYFDFVSEDSYFGEGTWEKAESTMLRQCFSLAADKSGIAPSDIEYLFASDLLNQCIASTFALRETGVPYFGCYSACSAMSETLSLGALTIDGGFADTICALTASHYCTAERQYRFPLEYGGQRTPTAQWTVTAAGAIVLTAEGAGPYLTGVTTGRIMDAGITDANNMGAAMAPAAHDTLSAHFSDTGRIPEDYDLIVTGDLGVLGHEILINLFGREGVDISRKYVDCGMLIYDIGKQDVHCGGSGCGCSAAVLASYLLPGMSEGRWHNILFASTGALLSPISTQQGESIPGICHAITLSTDRKPLERMQ